ncbi:MAG: HU family DNA-binding protein [Patescibacteria group bacterium]|nr:HU family DNA-binding protein [Patescibacteria group bacterium]
MTKKEIVLAMVNDLQLSHSQAKSVVQMLFDAITDTLATDGRIELRNFGVFEVKRRAPRKARNPKTGDRVSVPEKLVVTFRPGKVMEQRVTTARGSALAASTATAVGASNRESA